MIGWFRRACPAGDVFLSFKLCMTCPGFSTSGKSDSPKIDPTMVFNSDNILPVLGVDVLDTHFHLLALKIVCCLQCFRTTLSLCFVSVD